MTRRLLEISEDCPKTFETLPRIFRLHQTFSNEKRTRFLSQDPGKKLKAYLKITPCAKTLLHEYWVVWHYTSWTPGHSTEHAVRVKTFCPLVDSDLNLFSLGVYELAKEETRCGQMRAC